MVWFGVDKWGAAESFTRTSSICVQNWWVFVFLSVSRYKEVLYLQNIIHT